MSFARRMSEPVRAPLRQVIARYSSFFEHLLHAVKNEIVDRVDGVNGRVASLEERSAAADQTTTDQLALQAAAIRNLEVEMDRLTVLADATLGEVTEARDELRITRKELLERLSTVAPTGAREGSNDPHQLEWDEGAAGVGAASERIVEQPFAFAALADLPLGSRIIDVGGGESTVGLALASLGHEVTVVEPRGYPFTHSNLTVHTGPIETFRTDRPFDAAVLLSTIGHVGLDRPDGADADVAALAAVRAMVAPGGRVVLTAPYGPSEVTDRGRVYDRASLLRLVEGWDVGYVAFAHKPDGGGWEVAPTEPEVTVGAAGVVMLVATDPAIS